MSKIDYRKEHSIGALLIVQKIGIQTLHELAGEIQETEDFF